MFKNSIKIAFWGNIGKIENFTFKCDGIKHLEITYSRKRILADCIKIKNCRVGNFIISKLIK